MSSRTLLAGSTANQRKTMRKGTHSCFECRKRKVRCIFQPGESSICIPCKNRGSECLEQKRELLENASINSRRNLKDRLAKLEAVVEALAPGSSNLSGPGVSDVLIQSPQTTLSMSDQQTPPEPNPNDTCDNERRSSSESVSASTTFSPDDSEMIDPIASLFNNAIWKSDTKDTSIRDDSITRQANKSLDPKLVAKRRRTCKVLLSILPNPQLLADILNATCSWWNKSKPLGPWLLNSFAIKKPKYLQEFVLFAMGSNDPSIVGLAILCAAVSIQQLNSKDHEHIISRLPRMPGVLFQKYFEQVDLLIVNNSEYASTREGIEVIVMSAKMLMNLGLIKKAWVLYHRAMSYAQLLGLHRSQNISRVESDVEKSQRHWSWISLCELDVWLSLIIGLPYMSDCRTIPETIYGAPGSVTLFRHSLLKISLRVIDRNQMGQSLSLEIADQIQAELELAALVMGREFWDSQATLRRGKISRVEYFEWIAAQLWYHQLRVSLHMPLMIQSVEDRDLESHRHACLEGSRHLLRIYYIMRLDKDSAFDMAKLIDYQAFICSSLLILGVLGYGTSPTLDESLQDAQDRDLVNRTKDVLRGTAATPNNHVASQALQGLEAISSLHVPVSDSSYCPNSCVKIAVPFCGTITITPGSFMMKQKNQTRASSPRNNYPSAIFTLTHDTFPTFPDQNQYQQPEEARKEDFSRLAIDNSGAQDTDMIEEVPSIDLDWGNMINMTTEEDWAWLNDVNNHTSGMT